jgi:hypothetical protein
VKNRFYRDRAILTRFWFEIFFPEKLGDRPCVEDDRIASKTQWFAQGLSLCIRYFVAEFLRCNLLQAQTLAASFIQKDRPNNPNI